MDSTGLLVDGFQDALFKVRKKGCRTSLHIHMKIYFSMSVSLTAAKEQCCKSDCDQKNGIFHNCSFYLTFISQEYYIKGFDKCGRQQTAE